MARKKKTMDGNTACRLAYPCGFGGDESLVVDNVQKRGFNQLGLHNGTIYAQDGFAGEYHTALGDGIDISGKTEGGKHGKEVLVE